MVPLMAVMSSLARTEGNFVGCTKEVVRTDSKHMLGLGCLPQAEYNMDLEDRKKIHRLLSLNVITQDSQECYGMPYYHSHGSGVQNSAQPKTLENRRSHPVSAGLMHC